MDFPVEHPQFFTATIHNNQHLLKPHKYKRIITDSLWFLYQNKRVYVYAFVVMINHLHIIWQMRAGHERKEVQRDFLKFTGQSIKFDLAKNHPKVLPYFQVDLKDRKYQFWQRNPLSIDLFTPKVFDQKLCYIHENPVRAGLCTLPEEYRFSSAGFYETGNSEFSFLTHCDA